MQTKQNQQVQNRVVAYIVLSLILILGSFALQNVQWQTTARTHTVLESIATFLALFVGVIALVRYYSQKHLIFLLVGAGFFGTAMLDSFHTFVTSTTFPVSYPTTLPSLIPWSWMASRVFLALFLGVGWHLWPKQKIFASTDRATEILTYSLVIGLTLASFLFFTFVPLPRQVYYPGQLIPRPWELIPALFFLFAAVTILRQGSRTESSFTHWLVIALIINTFLHFPAMAVSSQLFDVMFNLAHILKILGYVMVIVGLLISTYHLFKRAEDSNQQLKIEIIERKRVEETLREREQQFRLLFELAPTGMAITSLEGMFQQVNQAFADTVGYAPMELLTKSFMDITHPDDLPNNLTFLQQLKQEEISNYQLEKRYIHKSGQTIYIILQVGFVRSAEGKPHYLIAQVVDITERKRSELALAHARDQALEASRLKTELLAKVSHELRTPLGAILGYSQMLTEEFFGPLSDEQTEKISDVIDSAHYLTKLVNELLDQSQLQAGKLTLSHEPFSPRHVVEQMQAKMQIFARNKGLNLATNVATDVPATLSGDPIRVQQILVNLVSNAIKFTQQGEVQVHIRTTDATHWVLQVTDTGPGIPEEFHAHIFDPFGQVDGSVTRAHDGTGLGLSIVKQLATLMRGQVSLDSEVGQGSTFTVLLPLNLIQDQTE